MIAGRKNKYELLYLWYFIYMSSKILWDKIPIVFEAIFILSMAYEALRFFNNLFGTGLKKEWFLAMLFALFIVVNAAIHDTAKEFVRSMYEYVFYIFPMCAFIRNRKRINIFKCLKILTIWGAVISGLSWYEYMTRHYLLKDLSFGGHILNVGSYGFRSAVFTRSYLSHGMILGILALVAIYLWCDTKRKYWLFIGLFEFASIITTGSRGPLVATAVALALFYYLDTFYIKKSRRRKDKFRLCVLILTIVFFAIMLNPIESADSFLTYYIYRIQSVFNWKGDAGNVGRLLIWRNAINEMFLKAPILGVGPSKTGSWTIGTLGVTESGVLRRLCEFGIVGFVIFYSFMFNILKGSIKSLKRLPVKLRNEMVLWLAIFIAIFINDFTVQTTEEIMISFWWWISMGGIYYLKNVVPKNSMCDMSNNAVEMTYEKNSLYNEC